jgi:quinol monooxygenase YgiN
MSTSHITVVVRYHARPEHAAQAARELTALVTAVVDEHACLGIELLQDPDDPTRFLLYERWTGRETYLGDHMRTPHLGAFVERAREFLAAPPEITLWQTVGTYGGEGQAAHRSGPAV